MNGGRERQHEGAVARWRRASERLYAARYALTITALAALVLSWALQASGGWPIGRTVSLGAARPELGHAFVAALSQPDLSADRAPLDSVLYEVVDVRGAEVFQPLDARLEWLAAYRYLRALIVARRPGLTLPRRIAVGPGNQPHDRIRGEGGGRYSVWRGQLYFSTPDNSSPLTNDRRYELFVPLLPVTRVIPLLRLLAALVLVATTLVVAVRQTIVRVVLVNLAPGVAITVALAALAIGGVEAYLRLGRGASGEIVWPGGFDAVAGVMFQPGAEVVWTNHVDFWTRERVNSLGFLDREPVVPKPAGRFRVLLVGDSFIEAAQVPNTQKVQALLEQKLAARLGPGRVDVVAFAHSGTGQANQLGFYERFAPTVSADLVVLVGVANDLANNSPLLESVRNGWHPYFTPRLFFEIDGPGFRRLPPTADWAGHRLSSSSPGGRFRELRRDPVFASRLAGWRGPDLDDLDATFAWDALPPLFADAVALTRHAFAAWRQATERDHARLAVVATAGMTRNPVTGAMQPKYLERFRDAALASGLPFLDLAPTFFGQPDPEAAHWRVDAHWSPIGHQWAAEAIDDFLARSGLLPAR